MSYYEFHVAKRYVQFEGALSELPKYISAIGTKLLILTACDPIRTQVETVLRKSFSTRPSAMLNEELLCESARYAGWKSAIERLDTLSEKLEYSFYDLGDAVVCEKNIRLVAEHAKKLGIDTVVGIGGGKGMDFARALTRYWPAKVVLVPTLAATNASTSPLSVLYSEDGARIQEYWRMDSGPELVLADTSILIRNGAGVLAAGIGDIVSAYFEARCNLALSENGHAFPELTRRGLDLAIEILFNQAPAAIESAREGHITPQFESVLSMILHNCGPLWMACTVGYAHLIDEVFLHFDAAHRVLHGLRVGLATLAMLYFQGADGAVISAYRSFCMAVGIPTSLAEIGLGGIPREEWRAAFEKTVGRSGRLCDLPFRVTPTELVDSILTANR